MRASCRRDHLNRSLGAFRLHGQPFELCPHDLDAADRTAKDTFIKHTPQVRATSSFNDRLPFHPGRDLLVQVVLIAARPNCKDRPRVVLGLQETGNQQWLVGPQRRGFGFDISPGAEPARVGAVP